MRSIMLAILMLSIYCLMILPANCAEVGKTKNGPPTSYLDDDGGPEPPVWASGKPEFQSWFEKCQKHINKVWKDERTGNQITDAVGCTFFLKPDGSIEDLFVYTFGKKNADLAALKIVQKASPFVNPPVYLLNRRRMLITFDRLADGQPNSKLQWDEYEYLNLEIKYRDIGFQEIKRRHI